jgi:hypothetical protein
MSVCLASTSQVGSGGGWRVAQTLSAASGFTSGVTHADHHAMRWMPLVTPSIMCRDAVLIPLINHESRYFSFDITDNPHIDPYGEIMHIESLPIEALQPAPYNPRITLKPGMPAYERLARSLDEFALVQPLVWNRHTGHVVGGHQRLQILRDRGVNVVDCVVVELSLEREKVLNVALNNALVGGDWDGEKLSELLQELQVLPDFDVTLTGFRDEDLRHLTLLPSPDTWSESQGEERPVVELTLEILQVEWETTRPALDEWLATHPTVRVHERQAARRSA